jgi:uncharacterized protein YndB with AHSA1/START domain
MVVSHTANSDSFKVTMPSDEEIRMTRLFNATRRVVFEMMTNSEQVQQWRGRLAEDYSAPVCEHDLRVGGGWRFVWRHPWGEVASHGEYQEITPPRLLVFTEIFDELPGVVALVRAEFTDEGARTRLTTTARYPSLAVRDVFLASDISRIVRHSYERLDDVLAALQP